MDPLKNQIDDRTSYTDLDEQFYNARLDKKSVTRGDWPSQIDRAAIDVTYGVALGTADSAFDHGATIGRMDFGTACGPHYVEGLQALAGSQSDLPGLIAEYDASEIGDLAFRLNELRVELTKLELDDSEIGSLNRATEALIEKLITQHGDESLSRQPLQQPEAVADLLYQLFSDPAVTNYADILIDSLTADTGNSIGGDSLLTHLDRPQMVTPLWDHQQRAIKNWVANETTGYVNMATATGKTVLGLATIAHLFGDLHPADTAHIPSTTHSPTGRATVLIVAGQDLLLEQWQSEFDEHLNIPRSRTEPDGDNDVRRIELSWGDIEFRTAQDLLADDTGLHYDLVILDEAHRYSSGRRDSRGWRDLFDDLTTNASSILAMSGSIDDKWLGDSGAKDALEANLDQCLEFGITEAREKNVIADFRWDVCYAASNPGDTVTGVADSTTTLTPAYDTTEHKFTPHELTGTVPGTVPNTFETLRDLRSFAQSKVGKNARDTSTAFDTFATAAFSRRPKRWQLNPTHDTIRHLLADHVPDRKAVVLVQSYAQADAVSKHLTDQFNTTDIYTPAKDEAAPYDTITAFKQSDSGVLVGPGEVLGVGVDLPDAAVAVNLGKGGVNASLIQRIGRILRNPTGDKHAHFYHVVTIPGDADARIPGEDGRRLLRRAAEFRALGSRFREHPGFVTVTDTTSQILRELETAGARATIADHRKIRDIVNDDVACTLLEELTDEISTTLDNTRDLPVLTTYWQPESLTPGAMPVHDSVDQPTPTNAGDGSPDAAPTSITVTVTDANGSPIENAAVIAETTTNSTEKITDTDGTTTITPPASGSNPSLFVSRAGHRNQTQTIPTGEDTITITLLDTTHTTLTAHATECPEPDNTATNSKKDTSDSEQPNKTELCAELHRVDNLVDGYPVPDDITTHSTYTPTQYTGRFNSWSNALHAADIDPEHRLVTDVKRVADKINDIPTISDISKHGQFTPVTLGEHFGSFDAAIAEAGITDLDTTDHEDTTTTKQPQSPDNHTEPTDKTTQDSDTSQSAPSKTTNTPPQAISLPDGRIDTLTVTVLDYDLDPNWRYDAHLQVVLKDGAQLPLNIWSVHDLSLCWSTGATYTIEQVQHKIQRTSNGTSHVLRSTRDFCATRNDTGTTTSTPGSTSTAQVNKKPPGSDEKNTTGSSGTPSRTELLDAVQHVAETNDQPLKATDVSGTTQYTVTDITRVFGSWKNALEAADIDNAARLIDDLHRVANKLGHRPTTAEMNEHGYVSSTTYANYFGTYTIAVEQAFDEGEPTQSLTDIDTPKSAATDTGTTEGDAGTDDQENTSDDKGAGTSPADRGILGDIMDDFDEFSDSKTE